MQMGTIEDTHCSHGRVSENKHVCKGIRVFNVVTIRYRREKLFDSSDYKYNQTFNGFTGDLLSGKRNVNI